MKRAWLAFYIVAVFCLIARLTLSETAKKMVEVGKPVQLEGTVRDIRFSEGRQIVYIGDRTVWADVYPRLGSGDLVSLSGVVQCPGRSPSCSEVLVKASAIKVITTASTSGHFSVFEYFDAAHKKLTTIYFMLLPKNQAELISGIVFGGSNLSSSFKSRLADVGLSHIVAASGMNVTFFAGLAFSFLSLFRAQRKLVAVFGCTLTWFYCGLAGFEPPVVRAGLMVSLTLFAQAFGRNSSSWWGLGLAGYIMLWVNPALIRDFGFLLSFSSMIGQISVSSMEFRLRIVWKLLAQSLVQNAAAILATLPVVICLFGRFSLVTIITNILVVWTVEPLMILGMVAVILGFISYELCKIVLLPAGILLFYFNWVADYFEAIPWAVIRLENPGWPFVIGYYMFLGGMVVYFKRDHFRIK